MHSRRSPTQRELDRAELVKMVRRGWTQAAIAQRLGVTPKQVQVDWQIVVKEMRESRDEDALVHIAIKLEEYAEIKREAWEAWEASKEARQKIMLERYGKKPSKNGKKGDKGGMKITKTKEGRLPGSEYMRIILDCIKAERELMALDPTKETRITGTISWDAFAQEVASDTQDVIENKLLQLTDGGIAIDTGDGQQPCSKHGSDILSALGGESPGTVSLSPEEIVVEDLANGS